MKKRYSIVTGQHVAAEKAIAARELRKNETPAEAHLWSFLRGSGVGFRFRRQQVIDGFIVDFYCHAAGLVVEIDGEVHLNQEDADAERTSVLEGRELKVIRFTNDEVLTQTERVLRRIESKCRALVQGTEKPFPSGKGGRASARPG